MITFFVPGLPKPQGSKKAFVIPGKEGRKPRAVVVDANPGTKSWQREVQDAAKLAMAGAPAMEGPIYVETWFTLPRPRTVREKDRPYPTVKPDGDKLVRAVWDALSGIAFVDDAQVVRWFGSKDYGAEIGVTIAISPLVVDKVGVGG